MANELIRAAGGIVWKRINGRNKIALVYRERYGGKWSLPKGKLLQGESWQEAAIREIGEEISEDASIHSFADIKTYPVDGTPKVVVFFHMLAEGASKIKPDREVVKMEWVEPEKAFDMLAYEEEKKLIETATAPGKNGPRAVKKVSRFLKGPGISFSSMFPRIERLESELKTTRKDLEYRISTGAPDASGQEWSKVATDLLDLVANDLNRGSIDSSWKALHAARRSILHSYSSAERESEASVLRLEAEKLNKWRKNSVLRILGPDDPQKAPPDAAKLVRAAELKDEHYNNNYYKNRIIRNTCYLLLGILVILVFITFIYLGNNDPETLITVISDEGGRTYERMPLMRGVLIFGLLGACISSLLHIRNSSKTTRIPEIVNNNFITITRVFVGGASAIVIFIFLESGFSDQLFTDISLRPGDAYTYFAIAFVAGFTERLLLRAISSIVGKE